MLNECEHTAEARHRWLVRAGLALLLLLSVAPATGHLAHAAAPLLDRCRELLAQCALVLRSAGAPLRWLTPALLVAGLLYAVVDRVRLTRRVSHLLTAHRARRARSGEPVGRLARQFGVEHDVRVLVGVAPNPAFTAGLLRPRIYVSERLQQALSLAELRAVFRHELHHYTRRDPLRFAVLRFATKTFFWLPLIGFLAEDLMADAELMADDFAASPCAGSDPLDVASALVKIGRISRANAVKLDATPAIGGFRLLDRRVRRLVDEPVPAPASIPRRPVLLSSAALLIVWLSSTFVPGVASADVTMRWGDRCPHSMEGTGRHCAECERRGEPMPGCPEANAPIEHAREG